MTIDASHHPVVQPVPDGLPRPPGAEPVGSDEQPATQELTQKHAGPAPQLPTSGEWAEKRIGDVLGENPDPS